MFPVVLDEYVGEDNPVRAIGVFVDPSLASTELHSARPGLSSGDAREDLHLRISTASRADGLSGKAGKRTTWEGGMRISGRIWTIGVALKTLAGRRRVIQRGQVDCGFSESRLDDPLDDHPPRIADLIRQLSHAKPLLADTNAVELHQSRLVQR